MYRVFLSYNTTSDEMVIVWRLQTLASASGLKLIVPNPSQRSDWITVRQMIDDSDSVIALLTKRATKSKQVNQEIEYAIAAKRRIIPIIERGVTAPAIKSSLNQAGIRLFELNPSRPWEMESSLFEFLQQEVKDKETRQAIQALAGTFVGLFLLDQLSRS
jgi:hypothetical protein